LFPVRSTGIPPAQLSFRYSPVFISATKGERLGRRIATDAITTPVVNTSAYWFSSSQELIDFKV
jgi:cystathionine gamma-synthase